METKDRDSRKGSEEGVEKSNVVRLPRDWLGPREELVPFGPSAYRDRPEAEGQLSEFGTPSLTQDDFWGGDLDALPRPVIGPKPADGFSVRRGAGGEAGATASRAPATGPPDRARARIRWSRLRPSRVGLVVRPSLPSIHLGWAEVTARRRAAVLSLAVLVGAIVGAALLGLNLVGSTHPARETPQIAAVSPSTDGPVAPPRHVAALRPVHAAEGTAVVARARAHRVSHSSSRSTSHTSTHPSASVTYVARVTPTQTYQPAVQVGGTPAVSETPTTSTGGQSATTARQTSSSAAGPTGLGSQVGNNCNPKCRP